MEASLETHGARGPSEDLVAELVDLLSTAGPSRHSNPVAFEPHVTYSRVSLSGETLTQLILSFPSSPPETHGETGNTGGQETSQRKRRQADENN